MDSATNKYLTLTLAGESFALDIAAVREILDMEEITRVPKTPEHMLGVVNVRGNAVPVMDLRLRLGLPAGERTINTRIVIVEAPAGEGTALMGALADSVRDVTELPDDALQPPPRMGASVDSEALRGVARIGDSFVLVLAPERVFAAEDAQAMEQNTDTATESETAAQAA
jgi:purine-binding chemotaxis protein CheW